MKKQSVTMKKLEVKKWPILLMPNALTVANAKTAARLNASSKRTGNTASTPMAALTAAPASIRAKAKPLTPPNSALSA